MAGSAGGRFWGHRFYQWIRTAGAWGAGSEAAVGGGKARYLTRAEDER